MAVRTLVILVAAGSCISAGCVGRSYEGDERAPVGGMVNLDGTPLPYGIIRFVPAGTQRMAAAVITDGSYSLPEEYGPNVGEYVAQITGYWEIPEEGSRDAGDEQQGDEGQNSEIASAEQIVPARYNAASELRVTIVPGANTRDFDLSTN